MKLALSCVVWKLLSSYQAQSLSVRFLVSSSGTWTSELLWLASSRVGNDQRSVITNEGISDLLLGSLINVLLIVSEETLGDGLTDGVDLRSVTTSSDSNSHIDLGEVLLTDQEHGLERLNSQCWWVNMVKGDTVDSDHTSTGLDEGNSDGVSLTTEGLHILTLS